MDLENYNPDKPEPNRELRRFDYLGVLLLSIGIFVVQLIRHQVTELYATTLIVRTIILIALVVLYFISKDPLMISLLVIVGLGFVLTLTSYILDHKTSGLGAIN